MGQNRKNLFLEPMWFYKNGFLGEDFWNEFSISFVAFFLFDRRLPLLRLHPPDLVIWAGSKLSGRKTEKRERVGFWGMMARRRGGFFPPPSWVAACATQLSRRQKFFFWGGKWRRNPGNDLKIIVIIIRILELGNEIVCKWPCLKISQKVGSDI